ncbi:MAG TPA: hypothetical protein VMA34_12380 [Terracidiphilus sp.]|nr:hypothetical protein [Terracidiphilus sp.]
MQAQLAQMIALTCHANAALHGNSMPAFFPGNSTSQFCESIKFFVTGKLSDGQPQSAVFADSPETWLHLLPSRSAVGLRLHQHPQNQPGISDRNASAFVGGGRQWAIEVMRKGPVSEFWTSRWEVGDRNAPDRKIWRVSYWLMAVEPSADISFRSIDAVGADLRAALTAIRAFALANDCGNFVKSFNDALGALDDPDADVGYHNDLAPPGALQPAAQALLKAAQSAWVFGGMGSWNDMGFQGETQKEYERVSDTLFDLLNEAVEAAVNSSLAGAPGA